MIFLIFLLALQAEIFIHFWVIRKIQYDPTPDDKFVTWSKVAVIGFRIIYPAVIYLLMGERSWLSLDLYVGTCVSLHLLLFPIELNIAMGKPLHYLGKGPIDSLLSRIPSFMFRVWCFAVLSSGLWYAYFNQELL